MGLASLNYLQSALYGKSSCAGEFYINLTQAQVTWEERTLTEKNDPTTSAFGQECGTFFLIDD